MTVIRNWNDAEKKILWDVCKEGRHFYLNLCGFNQLFVNSISERCTTWNDPKCFHSLQWNLQIYDSKPSKKHSKKTTKVCLTQHEADPGPFCEGLEKRSISEYFQNFIWRRYGHLKNLIMFWILCEPLEMIMMRKLNEADKKYCEISVKKEGTSVWTSEDSVRSLWAQFLNNAPSEVIRIVFTPCNEIFKYVIPNRQKALISHQKSLFHTV